MRNVIATSVQTVAVVLLFAGLFVINPLIAAGSLLLAIGWLLAPERAK